MKKLTRSQRKKLIERVKTLLIVALCVCCVYNIVMVMELYGGQDDAGGVFWGSNEPQTTKSTEEESAETRYWSMSAPRTVMVAHSKGKYLFEPNDSEYGQLITLIETAVNDMYAQKNITVKKIDESEWRKALDGDFLYSEFTYDHRLSVESRILAGMNNLGGEVQAYSQLVMIPNAQNDGMRMLLRCGKTGDIFETSCETSCDELRSIAAALAENEKSNAIFAYELNLDVADENILSLDSMFMIPLEERSVNTIVTHIPENYKAGASFTKTSEFTVNLINAFGYNPNTVRRYADSDGKIIFVCETGTISVHPNGCVEYKALGENDGVSMLVSGQKEISVAGVVDRVSNLTQSILGVSGVGNEKNNGILRISDGTDLTNSEDIRVTMEYYVDNCRVKLGKTPAVVAAVKNGILVEYQINVKTIEKLKSEEPCGDVLKAIDLYCDENADSKKITECNLVYDVPEDDKEIPAVWEVKGE